VRKGQGVEVKLNSLHIVVGNKTLLKDNGIELASEVDGYIKTREKLGETAIIIAHSKKQCNNNIDMGANYDDYICCDKEVCGIITLSDRPRDFSSIAIQSLRKIGVMKIITLFIGG